MPGIRLCLRSSIGSAIIWTLLTTTATKAEDTTQLPIPRYVSMRHSGVNVHEGPGVKYPTAWIFTRQNLPVEITQQFENWRKIRDVDGTEGWVTSAALQGKRFVLIEGAVGALRSSPASDSALVAQIEPGVVARLDRCPGETPAWCQIDANETRGWIERRMLWGVYPEEIYPVQ